MPQSPAPCLMADQGNIMQDACYEENLIRDIRSGPLHLRKKIPVIVIGATGSVGQQFIELLANHPWFELVAVAASEKSQGRFYKDSVQWCGYSPIPEKIDKMVIEQCRVDLPGKIVFSALDASIAGQIEESYAQAGYIVVSNAKNHRMRPDVPLIVPEINSDHLEIVRLQNYPQGGMIVTNPNCVVIGLTLALSPLEKLFGIDSVQAVSMQAISGAGFPGVASLSILDNIIPYIAEEEEKLETEPLKILGKRNQKGVIDPASFSLSAQCNRVPVVDGHMISVFVRLQKKACEEDIKKAWKEFQPSTDTLFLPSAPKPCIYYFDEPSYPQPRLHRQLGKGMACSIGKLQKCSVSDYKFTVLLHNRVRGAAGGAILSAELLAAQGLVFW